MNLRRLYNVPNSRVCKLVAAFILLNMAINLTSYNLTNAVMAHNDVVLVTGGLVTISTRIQENACKSPEGKAARIYDQQWSRVLLLENKSNGRARNAENKNSNLS